MNAANEIARAHDALVVDQHTQQAQGYARLTGAMPVQRGAGTVETIAPRPNDRLLDVACGPGRMTRELGRHVASATGLDLTPAMLEEARAASEGEGLSGIEWVQGNGAALPFADHAFTLVTCGSAFHHFAEPDAVLAEMARVCAPGGRVVVIDVTPAADKTRAYDAMEIHRDPSHRHAHSVEELAALGSACGLHDPEVRSRLSGPMPYAAVLATSFPEAHTREELLEMMREDAIGEADNHGFSARMAGDDVMVTYPMSTLIWTRA